MFTSIQQKGWQVENEVCFLKEALQEVVRNAKALMLADGEAEVRRGSSIAARICLVLVSFLLPLASCDNPDGCFPQKRNKGTVYSMEEPKRLSDDVAAPSRPHRQHSSTQGHLILNPHLSEGKRRTYFCRRDAEGLAQLSPPPKCIRS